MEIPRIYISAIKKSSGKTTVSIAINRILHDMGFNVQPFKKGPDFIDPMWHSQASGNNCYNLDFFFLDKDILLKYFISKSQGHDISVIEGNHGLFDDIDLHGDHDNASLSKLITSPLILILDVKEMGRSIIPIILGCREFGGSLNIAGIILNKVQSARQADRLKKAIDYYTKLAVVGSIPESESIYIAQRHLGLSAVMDYREKEKVISSIVDYISRFVDIKSVIEIARSAPKINMKQSLYVKKTTKKYNIKIGLAYDNAFNFYYQDNIDALKNLCAEIKCFSPLHDKSVPEVDGLYLGGGFPELFIEQLNANLHFREDLKGKIENGLSVYAECGGLLYLTKDITYNNETRKMVGVINTHTLFSKKPKGHGYTVLRAKHEYKNQWFNKLGIIRAHEFHYGYFSNVANLTCVFDIKKGFGVNGLCDGIVYKNVLAGFTHIHALSSLSFFHLWIESIQK